MILRQWTASVQNEDSLKSTKYNILKYDTHIHTQNHFTALWNLTGTTRVSRYQSLTPIMVISYPLSAPFIYYDPWHPPCSIHVPDSLFPQSLSKFSFFLLAWHPPPHTRHISSPNHCHLFAAHAHTIATCSAVVLRLCHLILVSLWTLYLELYLNATRPPNHSYLRPLKCHLIFLSYRPGLISMQHTTLHTTAVQSPSDYQWYILNTRNKKRHEDKILRHMTLDKCVYCI